MDLLKTFFPCFSLTPDDPTINFHTKKTHPDIYPGGPSEKAMAYPFKHSTHEALTIEKAASSIISALQDAEKAGPSLNSTIKSIVHQAGGWSEYLAAKIVSALEAVLKAEGEMNGALKEAYDKACEEAKKIEGFAAEHPVATAVFCTVIALGILVIVAPYAIEALGFGALGPVEGSWAAAWQATYRGYVSARSLFAFFQRLGMKWASKVFV